MVFSAFMLKIKVFLKISYFLIKPANYICQKGFIMYNYIN